MDGWIWILLGLIFLIFTVLFLAFRKAPLKNTILLEELLKEANTGDLVFFSGTTLAERAIKIYTRSPFSHVGIIFKDVDEHGKQIPFLWEADIGQSQKDGPRVIKLSDKIERWKGDRRIGFRKYKGDRPSKEVMMGIVSNYINLDMDSSMMSWLWSSYPSSKIFQSNHDPKKVFCSELVAITLQTLGILSRSDHPTSYSPATFAKKFPTRKGEYEELMVCEI
jgi:hypothetical protein